MLVQYDIGGVKSEEDVSGSVEGISRLLDQMYDHKFKPNGGSLTGELTHKISGSKMASITLYAPDFSKMFQKAGTEGSA